MKKMLLLSAIGIFSLLLVNSNVAAHCEIPCGIYDDQMRINMIMEHISTIEKSMNQIIEIGKAKDHNANQLVRWVINKENHADELQQIVSRYFMTQRIKPDTKDYDKKIGLLHQLLIYSMKCKQTTDPENVQKLRSLTADFKALYFSSK